MMTMRRTAQAGFTLGEIMIAIAIIAIMAAVAGPYLMGYLKKARIQSTKTTLRNVQTALQQFNVDMNQYPETLKDLIKKPADEALANKWVAPYLQGSDVPSDGWGNKFHYELTQGQEHPYELYSYGPDGKGSKEGRISIWSLE